MTGFREPSTPIPPEQCELYFDRFIINESTLHAVSHASIRSTLIKELPDAGSRLFNTMGGVVATIATRLGAEAPAEEHIRHDEAWQYNENLVGIYQRREPGRPYVLKWGIEPCAFLYQIEPFLNDPRKRLRQFNSGPVLSPVLRKHFGHYVRLIRPFFDTNSDDL